MVSPSHRAYEESGNAEDKQNVIGRSPMCGALDRCYPHSVCNQVCLNQFLPDLIEHIWMDTTGAKMAGLGDGHNFWAMDTPF